MQAVAYPVGGLAMRIVLVIGLIWGGVLLASCTATGPYIADNLPEWAGGLPKGTPPRAGTPGYNAYLREISGDHSATADQPAAQPAAQPNPPARQSKDPVDQPIH
jgi:hypothetical protein